MSAENLGEGPYSSAVVIHQVYGSPAKPANNYSCPGCGSIIVPEDYETDSGAAWSGPFELTCRVCNHHLAEIIWHLNKSVIVTVPEK